MVNYIDASLDGLAAHYIGSFMNDEKISCSKSLLDIKEEALQNVLLKFFFSHFKEPEFFRFKYNAGDITLNPVFNYVGNIFDDPSCLYEQSVKIAGLLYEKSKHPNIKVGELYISYISNVIFNDEVVDAVGIFKTENKDLFLKLDTYSPDFTLKKESGTNIGKMDKGCIIFNTDREDGFKIYNIDHSNKNREAQYWRDEFLLISECNDEYHQTKNYIEITKNFIKNKMPKEFNIDKVGEGEMLQRSFEYFKNENDFKSPEYEELVFKNDELVDAFRGFKEEFQSANSSALYTEFEISDYAFKKQSKVFKSIIKLDKNFHIYVHGDKNKIVRGTDDSGKKYYMLYYEEEN